MSSSTRERVLKALATPASPTDVAELLGITRSAASQCIKRLVAEGLVVRVGVSLGAPGARAYLYLDASVEQPDGKIERRPPPPMTTSGNPIFSIWK